MFFRFLVFYPFSSYSLLLLLVFLPLLSALLVLSSGRSFGRHGTSRLTIGILAFICILAWFFFFTLGPQELTPYYHGFCWFKPNYTSVTFDFIFNNITLTMFVVITTISFIVHWYSYDYMYDDPHLPRFMAYLSLFTFFMLLLVSAADLTIIFIGWEGVGIMSYLLINFWYTRLQANKSALKAVYVNKIGDIAFLGGIILLYKITGSTNMLTIHAVVPYLADTEAFKTLFVVSLVCLIIGAVGKSAQLFLHVWLPDAMEGPTPVSALLHAATMVTAGVFLIIRNAPLFELNKTSLLLLLLVGSVTTFFAATTGTGQYDIKRIIAFSTCSQLGYMLAACGASAYTTSLFHLFNHAFFKALLFLAAGSVIHAVANEQDIRRMGGLVKRLPLTFSFFVIGSASLMGVPFLSGFYSKDFIIEIEAYSLVLTYPFAFLLVCLSAVLTAFYSFRLLFFVFFNSVLKRPESVHDASWYVQIPLVGLVLLSIFSGYCFSDFFIGLGTTTLLETTSTSFLTGLALEYAPIWYTYIPLFGVGLGSYFALTVFCYPLQNQWFGFEENEELERFYYYTTKWGFDSFYNHVLYKSSVRLLEPFYYFLDKGLLEWCGPTGSFRVLGVVSTSLVKFQSGSTSTYIRYIGIFLLSFFLVFFPLVLNFL